MHLILPIPLEFIIWTNARRGEIKCFSNCVNFWTNGIILFLEKLFGTWCKNDLFSLILRKQLIHMYDVELGFIWIWKYIESYIDNWFEKHLNCFKKITFHN
jgi:hypothetical protein